MSPPHQNVPSRVPSIPGDVFDRYAERFFHGAIGAEPPQLARLSVAAGAMPQGALDARDARHEAVGRQRLDDVTCLRVHLVDARLPELPDPEIAVPPRHAAVHPLRRSGQLPDDASVLRVDHRDLVAGELVEVRAVEGRARLRSGDPLAAHHLLALRIERDELVVARVPDEGPVEGDAVHLTVVQGDILAHHLCVARTPGPLLRCAAAHLAVPVHAQDLAFREQPQK